MKLHFQPFCCVQVVYSKKCMGKSYMQNDELNGSYCEFVVAGVTMKRIGVVVTEFL